MVYTYDIEIHKYHDSDTVANRLAGAVFELKTSSAENAAAIPLKLVSEGHYRIALTGETGTVTQITTPASGLLTIDGLASGTTYYLHETTAPTGYNKLAAPVSIAIAPSSQTTGEGAEQVTTYDYSVPMYTVNSGTATTSNVIGVINVSGTLLPFTGGIGTIIITAAGVGVIILGVVLTSRKKKRDK